MTPLDALAWIGVITAGAVGLGIVIAVLRGAFRPRRRDDEQVGLRMIKREEDL